MGVTFIGLFFGLIIILGGLALGLLISGLFLRASVAIVRAVFRLNGQARPASDGWSSKPAYDQPADGQHGGFNLQQPYSNQLSPYASPSASLAYPVPAEVLSLPSVGKAAAIIGVSTAINMLIGLVFGILAGFTVGPMAPPNPILNVILQVTNVTLIFSVLVVALKNMLPTSYAWASAVLISYLLLLILIGLTLGLLTLVPLILLG